VLRFGPLVREAMRGGGGTLVSGATRQGVSVIAGDITEDEAFRAIGYLPASVPYDIQVDDDRYAGLCLGPAESLLKLVVVVPTLLASVRREWIRPPRPKPDTYVVVLSPDSVRSKVYAAELDQASQASKRIVPDLRYEIPTRVLDS
jgi:hypothetical protein